MIIFIHLSNDIEKEIATQEIFVIHFKYIIKQFYEIDIFKSVFNFKYLFKKKMIPKIIMNLWIQKEKHAENF